MAKNLDLTAALQKLIDCTEGTETSLGALIDQLKSRGLGPLLLIPSLIVLLPTGAIPGIPSACGLTIFIIAIQLCFGDERPWLPKRIKDITISREKLNQGVHASKPYTKRIDAIFKPRLDWLMSKWIKRIIAFICGVTGLMMIPLEVIPFAAALPALAISLTAIGFTTEDGLVICCGLLATSGSVYLVITQVLAA